MARIRNKEALKSIAFVIKQIRREKGITQEDFLYEIGIHLGRIEMGTNDMSCSTLIAVCGKLGISVTDFFKKVENAMSVNYCLSEHEINQIQNNES
jgi:transcriptional regulator with XRE-family HTH domain